jgi:2-dehydro-3-deoxygluconokinase
VPPAVTLTPVDSSGAGDAFSAGYLACRLRGAAREDAARCAHELAGWTVMRGGAIPPPDHAAPYALR